MEGICAVDPLLGEAFAATRAAEVTLLRNWTHVIFETDSKFLASDIVSTLWFLRVGKAKTWVLSIRKVFKAQSAWSLHWVTRRLNQQAHLLAQWAARS
ncbi:hypothetical protein CJ030_MR8G015368 [Morella rubra]|uniref:RNase H type-1 domain-containing protein n=1 Tax=Morella rubra TaxID=262757 RepID=A0A6A1UT27_9ROSI|nr:hypothetical protein CJ030_MR8G015368 [Morella rubra]